MREHCQFGMDIIQQMPNERHREETTPGATEQDRPAFLEILQLDGSPLLKLAAIIAQSHHEKWDGSGYPQGLRGNEIPLEGRITAVADVFDALTNRRPYKPAYPLDKCFDILISGRGTHFDPNILDAFLERKREVVDVYNRHREEN